jgi:N6-L-threonylcarbamoyladenine synthase
MLVFVVDNNNKPLMPCDPRKAKQLLNQNKAFVKFLTPFTIQLKNNSSRYLQDISLGVDAGTKYVGVSAASKKQVLFEAEIEIRSDIKNLLATRRENRRFRKTRYRKPRFLNRKRKPKWLAPSIKHTLNSHIKVIGLVHSILPIKKTIVEVAQFDIQKIKNPNIEKVKYQQGVQLDFFNVREYVLFRDNHKCQLCFSKSKDKILNVHHIVSRKKGSNSPDNLITLCKTCHNKVHSEKLKNIFTKKNTFKDASQITTIRWYIYNALKEKYNTSLTYGYITKSNRIKNNLEKSHRVDARVIADQCLLEPEISYIAKEVRKNNRRLHKNTRKNNKAEKIVKGFQLFDKVEYEKRVVFIFGRRVSGYFKIAHLDGTIVHNSVNYKKLKLLEKSKTLLINKKRSDTSSPCLKTGVSVSSF